MTALMAGSSCHLLWRGANIEGIKYIFLPWNPTGEDWVLWTVDAERKVFMSLDPLRNAQETTNYPQYVSDAYAKLNVLMRVKFNLCNMSLEYPLKALQRDSISCDVMVCYYGHQLLAEKPLTEVVNTVISRKEIYKEIMGKCHPKSKTEQDTCPICSDGEENAMVQCNRCDQWLHCKCVGLTKEEAEAAECFFCP